jgi:nitroreductase
MNSDDAALAGVPVELDMSLGLAIFTQRSIRRFKAVPIPDHEIRVMLDAANKAPSNGNHQSYRFLYVSDPLMISKFGQLYNESWWAKRRDTEGWSEPRDIPESLRAQYAPAMRLANEMGKVPCLIFVLSLPPHFPESVFPAAQNLMLAGRALGIGSVPTRLHEAYHDDFRQLFSVPSEARLTLTIPIGYPAGNFGPTRRLPSWGTSFHQSWGEPVPWAPSNAG